MNKVTVKMNWSALLLVVALLAFILYKCHSTAYADEIDEPYEIEDNVTWTKRPYAES